MRSMRAHQIGPGLVLPASISVMFHLPSRPI